MAGSDVKYIHYFTKSGAYTAEENRLINDARTALIACHAREKRQPAFLDRGIYKGAQPTFRHNPWMRIMKGPNRFYVILRKSGQPGAKIHKQHYTKLTITKVGQIR